MHAAGVPAMIGRDRAAELDLLPGREPDLADLAELEELSSGRRPAPLPGVGTA